MKRMLALLTAWVLSCTLAACGGAKSQAEPNPTKSAPPASSASEDRVPAAGRKSNVLVAYFSATGNTAGIARHLQAILDADLYEISPEDPYTSADLNFRDDACLANREQNDPTARPAISKTPESPVDYEVVFLGYPIWWGKAPKIIYTFLESHDFGGVTIIPFCTSGSSGIDGSLDPLFTLAPDGHWLTGRRFRAEASESDVAAWAEGLDLPSHGDPESDGTAPAVNGTP